MVQRYREFFLAVSLCILPVIGHGASAVAVQSDAEGFVVHVPVPDTIELVYRLQELQNSLQLRSDEMAKTVEARKFGVKDAVITIVLPGGLLYAAFRQQQYYEAKSLLAALTAELETLDTDLVHLRTQMQDVWLVRLD